MADQLFFVLESEPARGRPARHDQRPRLQPFVVGLDANVVRPAFEIGHFGIGKARAELLRLLVHVDDKLRAVDAGGKAREIFHEGGGGELAAGLPAFENERIQIRASGVDRSCQPRASAPDNDHLLHRQNVAQSATWRCSRGALSPRNPTPRQSEATTAFFLMPELAEVEYYRRQWDPGRRQKIARVQLHSQKRIFRGSNTRALLREITGSRFLRSESWGKQMWFEFSGGNWIGLHLGMTGTLRVEPPGFRPEKHDHLALHQAK